MAWVAGKTPFTTPLLSKGASLGLPQDCNVGV